MAKTTQLSPKAIKFSNQPKAFMGNDCLSEPFDNSAFKPAKRNIQNSLKFDIGELSVSNKQKVIAAFSYEKNGEFEKAASQYVYVAITINRIFYLKAAWCYKKAHNLELAADAYVGAAKNLPAEERFKLLAKAVKYYEQTFKPNQTAKFEKIAQVYESLIYLTNSQQNELSQKQISSFLAKIKKNFKKSGNPVSAAATYEKLAEFLFKENPAEQYRLLNYALVIYSNHGIIPEYGLKANRLKTQLITLKSKLSDAELKPILKDILSFTKSSKAKME